MPTRERPACTTIYVQIKAFCVKLCLFKTQLRNFNIMHFPTLSEIRTAFPQANLSAKKGKYLSVITCLETEFRQRFQDFSVIEKEIKLFTSPFLVDAEEVEENLQLELIEIQCDDAPKNQHQQLSLPEFYRSLEKEKFPLMRHHNENQLTDRHLQDILRISTTKFTPDLPATLGSKAQHHCSH
uniref:Uncharacterized protein n=1 Tax=Sphaeramia orbicularis TaxID=375764 RepID=A0A672YTX3_9TELE